MCSQKEAVVKVAMVQKITNRVLEVTDAELENLGDCEFRVKLVNHRANLQHGGELINNLVYFARSCQFYSSSEITTE